MMFMMEQLFLHFYFLMENFSCSSHLRPSSLADLAVDLKQLQWNPSITDTTETKDFVLYSEVSFAQGVIIDHAPLTIMASYDYGP